MGQSNLQPDNTTLVLLAISVNLPGRVSPDGVDMLWQAREPAPLADWHSPFVTFAFSLLAPIFGSPTGARPWSRSR